MNDRHRKAHPSLQQARHERNLLRLVHGPGVVPVADGVDADIAATDVVTARGGGTLADLLAETGALSEPTARGAGARVGEAAAWLHADDIVHGDIKPANVVFAPDGDLWLIDFDAAGASHSPRRRGTAERLRQFETLRIDDDVVAIAVMVVECATAVLIDPSATWTGPALEYIGCSRELAADIAPALHTPPKATRLAAILQRRDDRLPGPPRQRGSVDPTPTLDIPSVAIAGLSPRGGAATPR